ncbi:Rieske 2Fe-2S domain-containing protein [Cupriavidus sp. D384]|uniref:Rieske 2Fe-2S domain-containing protein n=1 Tax=Cupriavidus sp. D384 TaxID=1538095 RepID=UPI0008327FA3|nr:Rieske 2Fe-2S domain-containing protein [Cupriavidus sp. D384]
MNTFDRNGWYPIASAADLPARHVYQATLAGQELAVWRDDNGLVNAWENRCPHRGLRLSLGVNLGHELRCQYHGWTYESGGGQCTFVPAHRDRDASQTTSACAHTFAVRESEGLVWASLGNPTGDPGKSSATKGGTVRTQLRSLPFNVSAEGVESGLISHANQFAEVFGESWGSVEAQQPADGVVELHVPGSSERSIRLIIQPHSAAKAIVHAQAVSSGHATLAFRKQFAQVLNEVRRALETEAEIAPVTMAKGMPVTQTASVTESVVVPFPRTSSTEIKCRVGAKVQETADIVSLSLIPMGQPMPQLSPGMHVSVTTPAGCVRQYSVVNAPQERDAIVIGVKLEPQSRGGSRSMHEQVQEGTELLITVPRNGFPLKRTGRRPVLVAGGIGITPILAMAQALHANGDDFEMHYFCRGAEHVPFGDRLRSLGEKVFIHAGLDPAETRCKLDEVIGAKAPDATDVYTCGPGPMINTVADVATQMGIPEENVRFELFKNDDVPTGGDAFEVELSVSGKTFTVPSDKSLLKACWENGVQIEASCEQGVCGTCMTGVVSGDLEHHDTYLSKQERASGKLIMPCVSRCKSGKLVLDL